MACVMLAAFFSSLAWLAYDADKGCVLSGCQNGGQCVGFLIFRTCKCKGLHAGTRCAHHCNVSAPHLPHACQALSSDPSAVYLLAGSARATGRRRSWRAPISRHTTPTRAPAALASATATTPARLAATVAGRTAPATARRAPAPATSRENRAATAAVRTARATVSAASAETAGPACLAAAAARTTKLPTAAPGARAPATTSATTASSSAAAATA